MDVISGKFLINGELKDTSVGIEDGKIVTVGNIVRGGDENHDFKNKIILPGFTDPHVHFRDPGFTQKEDFGTGTKSALFGGVTCVLDMPNTKPAATDVRSFREKKTIIKSKAFTDYGLFAAITPDCNVDLLAPMAVGFKLFMGSTTGNILVNDDLAISETFKLIKRTGKVISVHAEDDSMIRKDAEKNNMDHMRNRPIEAERNAISRLSKYKGMRINICHCTDAGALDMAAAAGFTTEVTAHHLLFCAEDKTSAEYKVNPPIRTREVRDALYRRFAEGKATMFGSDHAPHAIVEKSQDYQSAPSGVPGVETTIPIFMELVKKNLVPLQLIAKMGCENPAKVFGLNKGKIAVGYDADFAVFDIRKTRMIKADDMHSRCGFTPYEGMEALFPTDVFVRGERQIEDSEFVGTNMGEDVVARD